MATHVLHFDPLDAVLANGATASSAGISHPGREFAGDANHVGGYWPRLNLTVCVDVDSAGNVYALLQQGSRLYKLDPTMTTLLAESVYNTANLYNPRGMVIDEDAGEIYICSVSADKVAVLAQSDLSYIRQFPVQIQPDDVCILPNGNILTGGSYNNVAAGHWEYTKAGVAVARRTTTKSGINTCSPFRFAAHPSNGWLVTHRRAAFAGIDGRRSQGLHNLYSAIGNGNGAMEADASCVALYHFSTGAEMVDSSGNGYTATQTGTTSVAAKWGQGRLFDAVADRVECDAIGATFNPKTGSIEIEASAPDVAFWTNGTSHYLAYLRTDISNLIEIVKRGAGGANKIRFRYIAAGVTHDIEVTMPSPDALEHTFSMSFDDFSGAGELKAYIDGAQVGTTLAITTAFVGSIANATIGNISANNAGWLGTIDEVRLSSIVRTQTYDWVRDLSWGSNRTTIGHWEWPMPPSRSNDPIGTSPQTSFNWDSGWGDAFWDEVNGEWLMLVKSLGMEGIYRMDTDGVFFDCILGYDPAYRVEGITMPPGMSIAGIAATATHVYTADGYSYQVSRFDRRTGTGTHSVTLPAGATLNQVLAFGYELNKHQISYRLGGVGGWTVTDPTDPTPLGVPAGGQLLEVRGEQNVLYGATGTAPLNAQPAPLKLGIAYTVPLQAARSMRGSGQSLRGSVS